MVTSSIMKDMQSNHEVIYRPNAIRALARIIDVSWERRLDVVCKLMLGAIRPICRATLQVCARRPIIRHLFRFPDLVIPPLPPLAHHHQAMVERSARSRQCQGRFVWRRIRWIVPLGWQLCRVPGGPKLELHYAVPRAWSAVRHEGEGQDGDHEDGAAAGSGWKGCQRDQESDGHLYVDQICPKGDGRGPEVSPAAGKRQGSS